MLKILSTPVFGCGLFLLVSLSGANVGAESLAGRTFNRAIGQDFSFDPPYESFAGITYNPLTQTWFVTDNEQDALFEIQSDGTLLRTIDIAGLKRSGVATTDAEGITWMHGPMFALALHDGKEMAVVAIVSTTTALARAGATIYDISSGPGKPKGLTYVGSQDAFYWVAKDAPKAVVKAQISRTTGNLNTIWTKNVDNLPSSDLSDVTVFQRLSPNLFLVSESSRTIMEVDMSGATAVLKSSFSISGWPIPQAGGMTFGSDGNMYVVGKHAPGPEDDFNVFVPTEPIVNRRPVPLVTYLGPS